ncbi:hypothetical protein [Wolbachia endosymbiont (group A) of Brachyopa scutellaris]|uniref:hypothetical protein n=1 Tax=Wolbachia endosymbiont (group A) of Brachyopa scutellaris TaxID=3066140 RepID=UPI00313319B1
MPRHWDDKVEGTGMTGEGGYWDDRRKEATGMTASLTTVIPLRVSGIYAKRYRE